MIIMVCVQKLTLYLLHAYYIYIYYIYILFHTHTYIYIYIYIYYTEDTVMYVHDINNHGKYKRSPNTLSKTYNFTISSLRQSQ